MTADTIEWIKLAEQTGELDTALHAIAKQHYQKLTDFYKQFSKIIEPMMTLLTATLIAIIVIGLYWPIFNLGQLF
jgi:type II secretory pathway component PulF